MCALTTQMLVQGKGPFICPFYPQTKIPKHTIMIVHVLKFRNYEVWGMLMTLP
jgi:hypothetical protein